METFPVKYMYMWIVAKTKQQKNVQRTDDVDM